MRRGFFIAHLFLFDTKCIRQRMKTRVCTCFWFAAVVGSIATSTVYTAVDPGSTDTAPPELRTRTFTLNDPNAFYLGLLSFGTLQFDGATQSDSKKEDITELLKRNSALEKAVLTNEQSRRFRYGFDSETEVQLLIIKYMDSQGVKLMPPQGLYFDGRKRSFMVRASDDDFKRVEKAIQALNGPPQVTIRARWIEVNDEDVFKPEFDWFVAMTAKGGQGGVVGVITEPRFESLLKKIQRGGESVGLLSEAEVTTSSGGQAQVELVDLTPTNSGSVYGSNIAHIFSTNNLVTLDIAPYVETNGYTIQLSLICAEAKMVGDGAVNAAAATGMASNGPPRGILGQLPLPHARVRQSVVASILLDGQTAVLLLEPFKAHEINRIIFVTPTIIDAAGNSVHPADSHFEDYLIQRSD